MKKFMEFVGQFSVNISLVSGDNGNSKLRNKQYGIVEKKTLPENIVVLGLAA